MKYCPECGAAVISGKAYCVRCGFDFSSHPSVPAPEPAAPRRDRGLYIAIACVAVLCILTAGLWILWPHLRPVSASSGGGGQPVNTPQVPEKTPVSVPASEDSVLRPKTWWHGTLNIRNYRGDDDLEGLSKEVWGYIGRESDGRSFFEVYDTPETTDETKVLVSLYVELGSDSLIPVIGENDAWILEQDLTSRDADSLLIYLVDDTLSFYFPYSFDTESFDLVITLSPR